MIYKRDPETLTSIVIVKAGDKYFATARFTNDRDDFIASHHSKESLYTIVESKFKRVKRWQ